VKAFIRARMAEEGIPWRGGGQAASQSEQKSNVASDIGTRTVTVTFFPNKSAQRQRRIDLTLPELAKQIRLKTGPNKDGLPWLKLAVFGEKRSDKNCLRTNANTEQITGIEVEHDNGEIAFDTALAAMRTTRLRALLYTSPSYAPAAKERWRILLPLSNSQPPDARRMLVARVNGLFGGKLAAESFVLSQAYLYGSVNGKDRVDHRHGHRDCNQHGAAGRDNLGKQPQGIVHQR
jgi:hypothetical protein